MADQKKEEIIGYYTEDGNIYSVALNASTRTPGL
jgi:hypothetical protein